jgi:ubiquinone biosynthesis protein
MKSPIHAIPQLYRNVRRWTEILSILSKFGLADWISRLRIDFVKDTLKSSAGESLARIPAAKRMRMAMSELGPTFIKLGQLLSARPDLVGGDLSEELSHLQDRVDPEPFHEIKATLEDELGQSLNDVFAWFDENATATASIGQVHRAQLENGTDVAVKIQRTGVAQTIKADLEILAGLAQWADRIDELKPFRPRQIVAELTRSLKRELDFGREERNLHQFHGKSAKLKQVDIPAPMTEFSTPKVLTMEFLQGNKLTDVDGWASQNIDPDQIVQTLVDVQLRMIFDDGFFHADPHPGNILIQQNGRIALLDFGLVGRIGESPREDIEDMLFSVFNDDVAMLSAAVSRLCDFPSNLDDGALERDLTDFVGQYSSRSVGEFQIAAVFNAMFEIVRRHQLRLPDEAMLLLRVMITLEGSARKLSPGFQIIEALKPIHRKLMLRRLSPHRQLRKLKRLGSQFEKMAETMPRKLSGIIDQIRTGKIDINLDHRRLGSSVNRLVLGMLTSALFLGSALMLAQEVPPLLFATQTFWGMKNLSLLGTLGVLASFLLGCRLLWAMLNSGSLNQKD